MKLRIKKVIIKDFKGVENLEADFKDERNFILGATGLGKSTILDSIYFVLFGKNRFNEKVFNIEPKYREGENKGIIKPKYNMEITLTLDIDGVEHTFYKNVKKNEVKLCTINGDVFKKVKEYTAKVEELICSETKFYALTTGEFLLNNKSSDAREMIIRILPKIDNDKILEEFLKDNKMADELKKEISGKDINQISANLKYAKDTAKKAKTKLTGKLEQIEIDIEKFTTDIDIKALKIKKAELEKERDAKISNAQQTATANTSSLEIQRLENEVKELEEEMKTQKVTTSESIKLYNNYLVEEQKLIDKVDKITQTEQAKFGEHKELNKKVINEVCGLCETKLSAAKIKKAQANKKEQLEVIKTAGIEMKENRIEAEEALSNFMKTGFKIDNVVRIAETEAEIKRLKEE